MSWIHTVLHLKWYLKNNAGAKAKKESVSICLHNPNSESEFCLNLL